MPKFNVFVRKFWISPILKVTFDEAVISTDTDLAPGQLRKFGDWYYLTFLRILQVRNWNPITHETESNPVNSIRAAVFQINDNKLIVNGGKTDIKEIFSYLEALSQPLNPDKTTQIDLDKFFRIEVPLISLLNIVSAFETAEKIMGINKIRMRNVEIKLGRIDNCIINTEDYGQVRKTLEDTENGACGVGLTLKQPKDTTIYFDLDAQIRVTTKNESVEVENFALENAIGQVENTALTNALGL